MKYLQLFKNQTSMFTTKHQNFKLFTQIQTPFHTNFITFLLYKKVGDA